MILSTSWSKTTLCILKDKYGSQTGNAMEKHKMLWTGSIIAPGVQIYKFKADQMSSFQDMTYYDSIIGIFLNLFLSKANFMFEAKLF